VFTFHRYQFNPEYANNKIVIKVLLQAIAFAPFDPDFSLCMAMLGERMVRADLLALQFTFQF
jgi:hypothetical protein